MIPSLICFVMLFATASCTGTAPARPDVVRIVDANVAAFAVNPTVTCNRGTGDVLVGYECVQAFAGADQQHFAALSVKAQRAEGVVPDEASRLVTTSFGPGGGGSTYKGRTRDGAYDVVATEAQNLTEGQRSLLPPAAALIDKVLAAYDGAGRQVVGSGSPSTGERR